MRSLSDIKEYWNDVQRQDHLGALSGCQFQDTIYFLGLSGWIKKDQKILEVGVGLGYVTRELYEAGVNVSALDISDKALTRVSKYCQNLYLVENIDSLPSNYFDFIICHNTIQHIPTHILDQELYHIIRSLKSTGILALQFISSQLDQDTGSDEYLKKDNTHDQNIGCYCRSPGFLEKMINKHGGKCQLIFGCETQITDIINGSYVFHIRRAV